MTDHETAVSRTDAVRAMVMDLLEGMRDGRIKKSDVWYDDTTDHEALFLFNKRYRMTRGDHDPVPLELESVSRAVKLRLEQFEAASAIVVDGHTAAQGLEFGAAWDAAWDQHP